MGRLIDRVLTIPGEETLVSHRWFQIGEAAVERRIDSIGRTFLWGYRNALRYEGTDLARSLYAVGTEAEGFAFEGAAMALTLLDHATPAGGERFQRFLSEEGFAHRDMLHLGAGWGLGRLPWLRWRTSSFLSRLDPVLRWLVLDGYGFQQGYCHGSAAIRAHRTARLSGYAARAFDQGLGRSLWFVEGADVKRISAAIAGFPGPRHGDLWSGVGTACAYVGGRSESEIEEFVAVAGAFAPQLAQGATFAAGIRHRGGNPASHTDLACQVLCGLSAEEAAALAEDSKRRLPPDGDEPAYEIWRQRVRMAFTDSSRLVYRSVFL